MKKRTEMIEGKTHLDLSAKKRCEIGGKVGIEPFPAGLSLVRSFMNCPAKLPFLIYKHSMPLFFGKKEEGLRRTLLDFAGNA
ncbi:hypothetical protein [Saccharibacillus sacchari]|uniref:Uncharacterized protein n=1 Tax=Saccharibacillus sacchari TaxID=456493 RepID=A0ACC6PDE1_9BACL